MNSNEVRERWAERSGEYSPDYYAHYGPDEASEAVRARLDAAVDSDAPVLELGCSSGRHLAHLREHGYEDLHGIDVNDAALDVMAEEYPGLAADGTFYIDAIEDVVADFEDDRFAAVFSVETLQHIHPDHEWVFAELRRITTDLLVTVENEGGANGGGDEDDGGDVDDRDDGDDPGESAAGGGSAGDDRDVNYVNDEFPLYYRDWNRVFTDLGLVEVQAESVGRDTVRAFRTT